MVRMGAAVRPLLSPRVGRADGRRGADQRDLRRRRRRADPDADRCSIEGRPLRGLRARCGRSTAPPASSRSTRCGTTSATPRPPCPRASTRAACRCRCSSAGRPDSEPHAARARGAARGRAPVGRRSPAGLLSDASPTALRVIAAECARAAGELLRARFVAGGERAVASKSSPTDLVSQADLEAERAIRELLAARRPGDAILGEEGGETQAGEGLRWIVDPLDGTVNFLFGVPQWCVSRGGRGRRGWAWRASSSTRCATRSSRCERGGPATLDGTAVRGSCKSDLASSLVGDGLRLRGVGARGARQRSSRVCCRSCATCAAWAALRSTSPGRRPAATTPSTSAASRRGTSPRARCCASAPASSCARWRPSATCRSGVVVAPPGLIDELQALVT